MLHLLCCALWEREPDVHLFDAPGTDWQGILDIARRHTVHGLVASRMKAVARELEAEDVVEQCWLTMLEVGRANSQLDSVLADVVKALGVSGERAVLMKGQGVARYYAEPSLRVCGDIDLYTGSHTYEVSQRLTELVEGVAFTDEGNTIKHRSGSLRDVPLELHRLIVTDRGHKSEKLENAWADKELFGPHTRFAQLAGCQVKVPGAIFDAVFVFLHFYRHFIHDGISLRQLCDWMRCLWVNREEIDNAELGRLLREFELLKPWQLIGAMAVEYLGMPQEAMPFYRKQRPGRTKALLRLLLDDSNFGSEKHREFQAGMPKGRLAAKWYSVKHHSQFYIGRARLFPRPGIPQLLRYWLAGAMNKVRPNTAPSQENEKSAAPSAH